MHEASLRGPADLLSCAIPGSGNRTLSARLIFGVGSSDPLTFAGVGAVLFGVAFLACFVPARRVMTIDPQFALRAT